MRITMAPVHVGSIGYDSSALGERHVEREGEAAAAAAGLQELAHGDTHDVEAPAPRDGGRRAAGRPGMTMFVPTTTELAQNASASSSLEPQRLGHERLDDLAAVARPSRSGRTIARRSSSGQNVRSRWYSRSSTSSTERTGDAGQLGQLGVGGGVGPEAVARQQHAAERQRVAGALVVELVGQPVDVGAVRGEPREVVRRLAAGAPGGGSGWDELRAR